MPRDRGVDRLEGLVRASGRRRVGSRPAQDPRSTSGEPLAALGRRAPRGRWQRRGGDPRRRGPRPVADEPRSSGRGTRTPRPARRTGRRRAPQPLGPAACAGRAVGSRPRRRRELGRRRRRRGQRQRRADRRREPLRRRRRPRRMVGARLALRRFRFPTGAVVRAGDYRVHVGRGRHDGHDFFWGLDEPPAERLPQRASRRRRRVSLRSSGRPARLRDLPLSGHILAALLAPQGPIFIIGAMRGSGTTLLRLMLDSHENIAISARRASCGPYRGDAVHPVHERGPQLDEAASMVAGRADAGCASSTTGCSCATPPSTARGASEKTPLHTWHVGAMARLFPDAVFVGMVRHLGASTVSNMKRFHHRVGAARPLTTATRGDRPPAAVHPDRFVLLRYEDLVLRTEPSAARAARGLGEPWSESVLEHHVVQGAREHQRIEGKSRADDPVDASRIDKGSRPTRTRRRSSGAGYGRSGRSTATRWTTRARSSRSTSRTRR